MVMQIGWRPDVRLAGFPGYSLRECNGSGSPPGRVNATC